MRYRLTPEGRVALRAYCEALREAAAAITAVVDASGEVDIG